MNFRSLMPAALACLLILAFGCGEDDDNGGVRRGDPLNYTFNPMQGDSYQLNLNIDSNVLVNLAELTLAYQQAIKMKLDVDFRVDEDGGIAAFYEITEASIEPSVQAPEGPPMPLPFINLIFQELVGKTFDAPVNERGQPGEWSGIDEMIEAMLAKADELSEEQRDAADSFINEGLAKHWKLLFSALYAPTPPNNLLVGDTWKGMREASPGVMADLTYTLEGVENGLARIEFGGTLSAKTDVTSDFPGLPDEGDAAYEAATGLFNGHYMVDTATGLAVRYESGMALVAEVELIEGEDIDFPSIRLTIADSVSAELLPK